MPSTMPVEKASPKTNKLTTLIQNLGLEKAFLNQIDDSSPFVFKAPDHFLAQIEVGNINDPLLKQVLPIKAERNEHEGFHTDPVADLANNPTPSLIHKYHGRVLLIASPKCDVHCRYCFRRHFPYAKQINQRHWQQALDYINKDDSIHEVILSGGDPLALNEQSIVELIEKIEQIPHITTLRIHSRTPVVSPATSPQTTLLEWAQRSRLNKIMVVHCNHANELTEDTRALFTKYKQAGFTMLNQSVLLKGVNDEVEILQQLSHALFNQGVLPYYLNLLDKVSGSAHFEVDDKTAKEIHNQLRQRLPGYLVPKLVRDISDQGSKTQVL